MADASIRITAVDAASSVFESIKGSLESVSGAFENPKEAATSLGETLTQAFQNPVTSIQSLASSLGEDLLGALSEIPIAGEAAAAAIGLIAAAGAAMGGVLFELTDHTAKAGDEVEAFSLKTGVAVENVGPLQLAAQAAGGSLDQLSTIARQIDLKAATDQGGKFSAALADMGINADAFKKADFETQLSLLSTGLEVAGEKGNAMSDALAVGGRGMANNIPLLEKMNPELMAVASSMAMVWTPELIDQSRQFSTDLGLFEGALGTVATRIGAELLPVMSVLVDTFVKSPTFINGVISVTDSLAHGLGVLTIGLGDLIKWTLDATAPLVAFGTFVGTTAVEAVKGLYDAFNYLTGGFGAFIDRVRASDLGAPFIALRDIVTEVTTWIVQKLESIPIIGASIKTAFDAASSAFSTTATAGADVASVTDKLGGALLSMGTASTSATESLIGLNKQHQAGAEASAKYLAAWTQAQDAIDALWDKALEAEQQYNLKGLDLQLARLNAQQQNEEAAYAKKLDKGTIDEGQYWDAIAAIEDLYNNKRDDARATAQEKYVDSWTKTQESIDAIWDQAYEYETGVDQSALDKQLANLDMRQQKATDAAQRQIQDETQLQEMLAAIDASYTAQRDAAIAANNKKTADQTEQLWTQTYDLVGKAAGKGADAQIAAVQLWYDQQAEKAIAAGITDQKYYDALDALATAKMADVTHQHDLTYQAVTKFQNDMADGWATTFDQTLLKTGSFKDAFTSTFGLLKTDVLGICTSILTSFVQDFLESMLQAVADYVAKMVVKFAILETLKVAFSWFGFAGGGVVGSSPGNLGVDVPAHGFASGGPVYAADGFFASGTDTVPAMLTPGEGVVTVDGMSRLGQAGLAALNDGSLASQSAAPNTTINVTVNTGALLAPNDYNTQRVFAQMVQDALMPYLSTIQKWSLA